MVRTIYIFEHVRINIYVFILVVSGPIDPMIRFPLDKEVVLVITYNGILNNFKYVSRKELKRTTKIYIIKR